jgi:hypothetical protein
MEVEVVRDISKEEGYKYMQLQVVDTRIATVQWRKKLELYSIISSTAEEGVHMVHLRCSKLSSMSSFVRI